MNIDATVTVAELCCALGREELVGAKIQSVEFVITYKLDDSEHRLSAAREAKDRLYVEVDADSDDVRAAAGCGDPWDEDDALPALDSECLHDFISACTSGDRAMAIALSSRLFGDRNASTAESLLLSGRRLVS